MVRISWLSAHHCPERPDSIIEGDVLAGEEPGVLGIVLQARMEQLGCLAGGSTPAQYPRGLTASERTAKHRAPNRCVPITTPH